MFLIHPRMACSHAQCSHSPHGMQLQRGSPLLAGRDTAHGSCGYALVWGMAVYLLNPTPRRIRRVLAEDLAGAVHVYDAAAGRQADVALPQLGSAATAVVADLCRRFQQDGHAGSAVHSPRWRCWILGQPGMYSAGTDVLSLCMHAGCHAALCGQHDILESRSIA